MDARGKKRLQPFSADAPSKLAKTNKALRPEVQLPAETFVDLLRLLTRDELEGSGLVNVQFANASDAIFASEDVPPRKIENISVVIVEQEFVGSILGISATRSSTEDGGMDVELAGRGVEFLANLMRSSEVQEINLIGRDKISLCGVTSAIWSGLLDAFRGAAVDSLRFHRINFCPLSAAEIDRLTTLNLRTELYFSDCRLLSNHITDEFLEKLSRMGLSTVAIEGSVPANKAMFEASDDGVLALCFPDGQPRAGGRFTLENVGLTDAFFENFLQNCEAAPEDLRNVACHVYPIPSGTERKIMALNPTRPLNADGDIYFLFEECAFLMFPSKVPATLVCLCE